MVGIALGLRQFVQQRSGRVWRLLADHFGAKPMIVTGMPGVRAAGFATMAIAREPKTAAGSLLFPFRDWRHPFRPTARRAGG